MIYKNTARSRAAAGTVWADHVESLRAYSQLTTSPHNNENIKITSARRGARYVCIYCILICLHFLKIVSFCMSHSVQTDALAEELRRTSTEIEKSLNKITHMESVLNRQNNVSSCAIQYAGYKNVSVINFSETTCILRMFFMFICLHVSRLHMFSANRILWSTARRRP